MDTERFISALGPAVSVNAGGFAFQYLDPVVTPMVSSLGTNAKWAKVGGYTVLGILADVFLSEKGGIVGKVGEYGADALYGLSAATIAADPVAFPKTFRTATSTGTSMSPSFSVPTGSVIY